MKLYDCKVRLNGSLHNVVGKKGVTAAEIVVLNHIHGQSENAGVPVFDVTPAGEDKRTNQQERARLMANYRMGEMPGSKLIPTLLGVAGVKLPHVYVAEGEEPAEVDEAPAEGMPPPTRTKITAKAEAPAAA